MKRILVTESQFKRIMLAEQFTTYLPNKGDTVKPEYNAAEEVMTHPLGGDVITTDQAAKERQSTNHLMRRVGGSLREGMSKKKNVNEENQDLVDRGSSFNVSKESNERIQDVAQSNPEDKMMNNMANEKGSTVGAMYMRRNRIQKMEKEDPQRYAQINGDKLVDDMNHTLNNAKNASKMDKQSKQAAGMENVFQKAGGTKNSGNGKAHTSKDGNQVNFRYEY